MSKDSLFETQEQPVAMATVAERFGNRFEVESLLGCGSTGVLFRAKDRVAGTLVALKVLSPLERKAAERFLAEAEVLSTLNHPAIVHHVSHGLTPRNEPYLAVDWLDGENLGQRLARGILTPDMAARAGARALQALAAAHHKGLTHGNLKPSNLFFPDRDPTQLVLLGFGMGSYGPRTAQEQVRGRGVLDARGDLFSLGRILYECVTGQSLQPDSPWNASVPHRELADRCAILPHPLREILQGMLALDRDVRPAEADLLATELLAVAKALEGIGTRFAITLSPRGDFRVLFEKGPREPPHTLAGRPVPCFGRERELDLLESVWHEVCEQSLARAVVISAPAGGGKTRLRQELFARIRRNGPAFAHLVGGGDPMLDGAPLSLLGPAILSRAGLAGSDSREVKSQRLKAEIAHLLPPDQAPRVAAFLGEMAHIAFPEDISSLRAARMNPRLMCDQMRRAWLDWLSALCRRHPVMLVLEDLHWGDGASVALAESALRVLHDQPLMVMALAQPEADRRFMNVWHQCAPQRIHLAPLSPRQGQRLIEYVAGPLSDTSTREILERAQGNPFCLEELLRVVLAGGQVAPRPPDSAMGMVQTRVRILDSQSRLVLGACSVLGRHFLASTVKAIVDGDDEAGVERCLDLLEEQEILFSSMSTAGREFIFRHPLFRQAAYDMVPPDERRVGHRSAGLLLEQAGEPDPCVLAEHFLRGGDEPRALHWLKRAARHALHADDTTGTLSLVGRALQQGASDEDVKALQVIQAHVHLWHEEHHAAEGVAQAAASSCLAETHWMAQTIWLAALAERSQLEALGRVLASVETPPQEPELIGCWMECLLGGLPFLVTNEGAQARGRITARLDGLAEEARTDAGWMGKVEYLRARLAQAAGQPTRAQEGFVRAADQHARLQDRRAECEARAQLGQLLLTTGQLDKAEDTLRPLLATAQRLEFTPLLGRVAKTLGCVLAYRGVWHEARDLGRRALITAEARRDRLAQAEAEACLSLTELLAGHYHSAEKLAMGAAGNFGPGPKAKFAQALLARALLAQARTSEALRHAREAHARLAPPCAIDGVEGTIHLALAECLIAAGDEAAAHEVLQKAADRLGCLANTITDPTVRRSYLTELPEHARLLQLCRQQGLGVLLQP